MGIEGEMFEDRKRKESEQEGDKVYRIRETQKENRHVRTRVGKRREGMI